MPSQVGYEPADRGHEATGAPSAGGKSTLVVVVSVASNCRQTIGEDLFETASLWHKIDKVNAYRGRRGILIHAMSGIDLALWDIKGKALGLPVWELLGGGFHKKMRCYASNLLRATPGRTEEIARRLVDEGLGAVKFGWHPMGESRELGAGPDLMIEAGLV